MGAVGSNPTLSATYGGFLRVSEAHSGSSPHQSPFHRAARPGWEHCGRHTPPAGAPARTAPLRPSGRRPGARAWALAGPARSRRYNHPDRAPSAEARWPVVRDSDHTTCPFSENPKNRMRVGKKSAPSGARVAAAVPLRLCTRPASGAGMHKAPFRTQLHKKHMRI